MTERRNLPSKPSGLARLWFRISQICSVIGLISIIEDLKLWVVWISWLLGQLRRLLSPLADLLELAGSAMHGVLQLFRGVFRPILDVALQWLPFSVPDILKDAIVVAAFVGLGLIRTDRGLAAAQKQAAEVERARLHGIFRDAGIEVDRADTMLLAFALLCHQGLAEGWGMKRLPGSVSRVDRQRVWDNALERYGTPLFDFAMANHGKTLLGPETCLFIAHQNRARRFVWKLGIATALLVLLDSFLMR